MPAFPSWRSPDVTTTATEAADIQLLTYSLSYFMTFFYAAISTIVSGVL